MWAKDSHRPMRKAATILALCTLQASAQYQVQGRYLHQAGTSYPWAIVADPEDNIIIGGHLSGDIDFDPGSGLGIVETIGEDDGYVCKLDPSGEFQWVARFGGDETQAEWVQDLITDADGNIYVAGAFGGVADFDPGPGVAQFSGGSQDGYLVKLSPAGELIWAKDIGGTSTDALSGLAMTEEGDIIVVGYVDIEATVDGNSIELGNTQSGGLVASFQQDGTFNWARVLPSSGGRNVTDVCIGSDGSIYGCGIFSNTMDLDPGPAAFPVVAVDVNDGFYFKLDATGAFVWGGRFGSTLEDWCYDMDVDQDGAIYLAGHFRGACTIGNGADITDIPLTTTSDALVARIDPDGTVGWAHGIPASGRSHSVRAANDGEVLYSGYFANTTDFDLGPGVAEVTSQGSVDMFLARYTTSGDLVSVLTIGGTSGQTPRGLYLDGADVILASGYSIDVVDLDPGTEVLNDTAQNAATFYVRIEEEIVNAVSEFETTSTFYPNPVHSGQALFTGLGRGHVRLLDASGRVRTDLGILTGDRPIAVDLPDGVYLLEWNDGRMQVVRRFVVEER